MDQAPPPPPRHRLPSKVVLRRHLACPRSCSLRLGRRFVVVAPPGRAGVLGGALQSAWCVEVEDPYGR
jgi:hypothetical protein